MSLLNSYISCRKALICQGWMFELRSFPVQSMMQEHNTVGLGVKRYYNVYFSRKGQPNPYHRRPCP